MSSKKRTAKIVVDRMDHGGVISEIYILLSSEVKVTPTSPGGPAPEVMQWFLKRGALLK
jgi:hypothetical protein